MPVAGATSRARPCRPPKRGSRLLRPATATAGGGAVTAPVLLQDASGSTGAATSFTTITPTLPGAATANSRILLFLQSDATFTTPQGAWTALTSVVAAEQLSAWTRVAVGGETNWGTVTITGSTAWWVGEYLPAASTQPDVTAASNTGTGVSTLATPTTGTTTIPETTVVACWGISETAANPVNVNSVTNSFTAAAHGAAETSKATGTNVGVAVYQRSPGTTGTFTSTATFAGANNPASAIVVLRGAAAAAGPAWPQPVISQYSGFF